MPTTCTIVLDHSNDAYYSGETLNGTVTLQTTKVKSIRGIAIKIKGVGEVRWTESRSRQVDGKTQYYNEHYKADEQYLNSVTYLIGSPNSNSFEFLPGLYNYTFSCELPIDLPSNSHDEYGQIKYKVTLTIDRPFAFDNDFKRPFFVDKALDLNINPWYKTPQKSDDETSDCCFCCCCCCGDGDGSVKAELTIPVCGYTPGESISFKLTVFNDSNSDVTGARVKLQRCKTFESTSPSRKYKHLNSDLCFESFDTILRLTRKEFNGRLLIPNDQNATQTGNCISLEYLLKATVEMGCCMSNIKLQIPIIIGTIPIYIDETIPSDVITTQPTAPTAPTITQISNGDDVSPPIYKSLDLPTYEDAVENPDKNSSHNAKELEALGHVSNSQIPSTNNNIASGSAPPLPPPSVDYENGNASTAPPQPPQNSSDVGVTYGWKKSSDSINFFM